MQLPTKEYSFYAGIDPGFGGGIALINRAASSLRAWDMPVTEMGKTKKYRCLDLPALEKLLRDMQRFPNLVCGLENPTTRPGEGAERCFRFGRGIGNIEAMLHVLRVEYTLIPPNSWKIRLGLPGKDDASAIKTCMEFFNQRYPGRQNLIVGPKGGVKDGRLDAMLIAHFLRSNRPITTHEKGSVEAQAAILGWGGTRKNQRLQIRSDGNLPESET